MNVFGYECRGLGVRSECWEGCCKVKVGFSWTGVAREVMMGVWEIRK